MASCAEYSRFAAIFGVSKTTVHRCLHSFCCAMTAEKKGFINWYRDEEAGRLADITQANYKYPQAIGMYCIALSYSIIVVWVYGCAGMRRLSLNQLIY